ncbi:MAG: helix-turn-helix domain-containing protein [Saprospiraceae bacterium]
MLNQNHVLVGSAKQQYYWEGEGLLSIKTFLGGNALYKVGKGFFQVEPDSYLILNDRQHYAINIESPVKVTSFVLFFKRELAVDVYQNLLTSSELLLEQPASNPQPYFFERTYPKDHLVTPFLAHWYQHFVTIKNQPLLQEEYFHRLLERMLLAQQQVRYELHQLNFVKCTTREEIYRRVYVAKEYLHACYADKITLEQLATIAGMSENHLLRSFKQIFHISPYQYLKKLRLEKARNLLEYSTLSISEICYSVGFESLSSFSWLFKQTTGYAPEKFRQQKR